MDRALSAPGKVFLSGEYAVLWGGTARLAAVAPRTQAYVRRRNDREVHLVLDAGRFHGSATPQGVNWRAEVPREFAFAARAVDEVLRVQGREGLGFELAIGASPKSPEGQKLGLGGSACASVLAAEAARFVLEVRADTLKLALLAHASAQGGVGSGADVATCFAGGLVRYRRYPLEPLVRASAGGPLASALASSLPVDLARLPPPKVALAYAFSERSASTPDLIRRAEATLRGEKRGRFVARSDSLGQAFEDALLQGDWAALAEGASELHALVASIGEVETEPMGRILALAKSYGAAGKVSGAGGGDGCVLFCADAGRRAGLLDGLTSRGFHAFALELEPGLRGESSPPEPLQRWLDAR